MTADAKEIPAMIAQVLELREDFNTFAKSITTMIGSLTEKVDKLQQQQQQL